MMKLTQEQIDAGWKEWEGGDGPPAELVGAQGGEYAVMFRNGRVAGFAYPAELWCWSSGPHGYNIIAYLNR